ncbi:hypothetical protein OPQ81_008763 [Rhizoctonia solani]|nr:hypothetical protein OPQ81_008763 [Rhizoctonia solani]
MHYTQFWAPSPVHRFGDHGRVLLLRQCPQHLETSWSLLVGEERGRGVPCPTNQTPIFFSLGYHLGKDTHPGTSIYVYQFIRLTFILHETSGAIIISRDIAAELCELQLPSACTLVNLVVVLRPHAACSGLIEKRA